MEKINLNYNDIDYDSIVNKIKEHPLGKNVIEKLKLTDQEIKDNYELLNNYIRQNISCLTCSSMNGCNHSTKGLQYTLKRDLYNDLTDSFVVCKQYLDYYKRKDNLVFATFREDDLLDEKQKNYLFENASMLGQEFISRIIKILKGEQLPGAYLKINNSKERLKLVKSLAYGLLLNHKVAVVKFSDLLKTIKSEFNINNGPNTLKKVLESDILIIDGLGNEAITAWSRDEVLLSLLDNRIQSDKITILCSEFSLEELRKLYKLNYNDDVKVNQIIEKINEIKI